MKDVEFLTFWGFIEGVCSTCVGLNEYPDYPDNLTDWMLNLRDCAVYTCHQSCRQQGAFNLLQTGAPVLCHSCFD